MQIDLSALWNSQRSLLRGLGARDAKDRYRCPRYYPFTYRERATREEDEEGGMVSGAIAGEDKCNGPSNRSVSSFGMTLIMGQV